MSVCNVMDKLTLVFRTLTSQSGSILALFLISNNPVEVISDCRINSFCLFVLSCRSLFSSFFQCLAVADYKIATKLKLLYILNNYYN